KTRREDMEDCRETIGICTWLIGNLAVLLHPFLPFSSGQVMTWLGVSSDWFPQKVTIAALPGDISILFERIEEK
ncbi:MAG: methionine--tRNA ligase, partial [Clostridia bacterium]|nr:methionine--tRNA ligase [Clostridia bacterium]